MNMGQLRGSPSKHGAFIRGGFIPERLVVEREVPRYGSKHLVCKFLVGYCTMFAEESVGMESLLSVVGLTLQTEA